MKFITTTVQGVLLTSLFWSGTLSAEIPADQIARLGADLTPLGGKRQAMQMALFPPGREG